MARVEARPFRDYAMPWSRKLRRDFWLGGLWGIAGISVLMLAISAFGGYSIVGFALHGADVLRYTAFYVVAFVVVGIAEEFLFRGYVQFTLTRGIGFWPAALLTSAAFGATHLANPGEAKIGALAVFAIGLFLCALPCGVRAPFGSPSAGTPRGISARRFCIPCPIAGL